MTTRCAVIVVASLGAAGCGQDPPDHREGALGGLGGELVCFIYPADGFASIFVGDSHWLEVYLPAYGPDLWGRGTAYFGYQDQQVCRYALPGAAVRVQYGGALIGDPGCDDCTAGYRALFVEGLDFPAGEACSERSLDCDPANCRTVEASSAEALAVWCQSPDEAAP